MNSCCTCNNIREDEEEEISESKMSDNYEIAATKEGVNSMEESEEYNYDGSDTEVINLPDRISWRKRRSKRKRQNYKN